MYRNKQRDCGNQFRIYCGIRDKHVAIQKFIIKLTEKGQINDHDNNLLNFESNRIKILKAISKTIQYRCFE